MKGSGIENLFHQSKPNYYIVDMVEYKQWLRFHNIVMCTLDEQIEMFESSLTLQIQLGKYAKMISNETLCGLTRTMDMYADVRMWICVGTSRPTHGLDLRCEALSDALLLTSTFTHEEFGQFGIPYNVMVYHYVKVGCLYYQPPAALKMADCRSGECDGCKRFALMRELYEI